jgi:hypothetical protein
MKLKHDAIVSILTISLCLGGFGGGTFTAQAGERLHAPPVHATSKQSPAKARHGGSDEQDPALEQKLQAIRANPEANDSYALRGGFLIPVVAIVAVILGILNTQNSTQMAAAANQTAQSSISLQTSLGLPGEDKNNASPEL